MENVTHMLRQGETLEDLSARYHVPVCMIARANGFTEAYEYGKPMAIPRRCYCNRYAAEANGPVKQANLRYNEYIVQPEDTLHGIAKRFDLTMLILQRANGIKDAAIDLQPGLVLRIPMLSGQRYYVRAGESLEDIARRYRQSAQTLRERNFLAADETAAPGMCLLV